MVSSDDILGLLKCKLVGVGGMDNADELEWARKDSLATNAQRKEDCPSSRYTEYTYILCRMICAGTSTIQGFRSHIKLTDKGSFETLVEAAQITLFHLWALRK